MTVIFDAVVAVAFKTVPAPVKISMDYFRIGGESTSDRLLAGDVSCSSAAPRAFL